MVKRRPTNNDLYACGVAGVNHVSKLGTVTSLRRESVGDRLIICPPLRALNVLSGRAHYQKGVNDIKYQYENSMVP